MGKIYFQTRAYNAEKTFRRCVDSVLNQTRYGDDIIYYICDNGSTDRTGEMLRDYAEKDSRIRAFYNKENEVFEENELTFFRFILDLNDDDLFCTLDADDVYEIDFLEKMIPFIRENSLDFAVCGNDFIDASSGKLTGKRVMPQTLILDNEKKFTELFPIYHQFMRTFWGKLFTGKIARHVPPTDAEFPPEWKNIVNGSDTLMVFCALRESKRVGIYPETLHRYYIFSKSTSRRWSSRRIDSNQILYEDANNYLLSFGQISEQNEEFLLRVYANAISDSLAVLRQSTKISADDLFIKNTDITDEYKLKELRKIIDYEATPKMLKYENTDTQRCKKNIFYTAVMFAEKAGWGNADFQYFLSKLCPLSSSVVSTEDLKLFSRDLILMSALFNDNRSEIVDRLLKLIAKGSYTKQFDLVGIVRKFSRNDPLVSNITNNKFIRQYDRIYFMVWNKKYVQALDAMTDIMLEKKITADEEFIQLYLSLAAMLESANEFIFGKIRLAELYCSKKRDNDCRNVLNDIAEMGVEENEEITQIKSVLSGREMKG